MTHRFPIGTKFETVKKVGTKHIRTAHVVTEQMTVTNSKGEVVRRYYEAEHEFCGQMVTDHDVCDTTIARGSGLF